MAQVVPAAWADPAGSAVRVVPAASAALEGLAVLEGSAAQAGQEALALADLAASADQEALAAQADPAASAGQEALAAQADPAAGKPPIVRRGVLAAAPALRRGQLTVPLRGQAQAGREARRWAASEWAGPTRPSPTAAQ